MNYFKKITLVILCVACLLCSLYVPVPVKAQVAGPGIVGIGGRIVAVIPCNYGFLIYVLTVPYFIPLPVMYFEGASRLNMYYDIFEPGPNILGTYVYGGACVLANTTIPAIGTFTPFPFSGVGTSLLI